MKQWANCSFCLPFIVFCLPFIVDLYNLPSPAHFGVSSYDGCCDLNISDPLPFGHGGQELRAVFKTWGTLDLLSGVTMLSVPYIPDVALALLSMGATLAC